MTNKVVHLFTSTACAHGEHGNCELECEYCDAKCLCTCHIAGGLEAINKKLNRLLLEGEENMTDMKDVQAKIQTLTDDVTKQTDVTQAAVTLLNGISKSLADVQKQLADAIAANDPAAIQAAADALDAVTTTLEDNTSELSGAVVANTPANG